MTASAIAHLFHIIPERRQFVGGIVCGYNVATQAPNGQGYSVTVNGVLISNQGARDLAEALKAAADAAEAAS